MPAIAFSNNDIAIVAWTFDRHLDGCLGFAIHQIDGSGTDTILPALARFANQDKDLELNTAQAPIQKFWWKDLSAKRGGTYQYRITPMGGTPGHELTPLSGVEPLLSNKITLTEDRAPFKAYFNRGIVATQALSHALNDHPTIEALTPHILDPHDPIRIHLMGQLSEGVTSLLDRADKNGGTIHGALYELNDPQGLEVTLHANPSSRTVILGNEQSVDSQTNEKIEDADHENRQNLKTAGVTVIDRILGEGSIPHNKFMVLSQHDSPVAVLSGSTNWTSTGLCTQTNNALVIESKEVAQKYLDYWNAIKTDIDNANGEQKDLQSPALRDFNHQHNASSISSPIKLNDGVTVELMFSPNTNHKLTSPPKEVPNDMKRVFDLIAGAKHAVLFLAFDPGNNSILDAAGTALANNPDLFVRGALTSAQRALKFSEALHSGGKADEDSTETGVTVVGEPGKPKKKGEQLPAAHPDSRAVPATPIDSHDKFGAWEAELAKFGFAIIHNKIVVIDPFSDNCTVVTGSHNLGFRASHNNDENMVIVRGHRGLAEAYACHVLDLYDHYAWRFLLREHPDVFGRPLQPDDKWQERYIVGPDEKSPELRFWLSAAASTGGASHETSPPAAPTATPAPAPAPKPPASHEPTHAEPAPAVPAVPAAPTKSAPPKAVVPVKKKPAAARKKATPAPAKAVPVKKASTPAVKKAARPAKKKAATKAAKRPVSVAANKRTVKKTNVKKTVAAKTVSKKTVAAKKKAVKTVAVRKPVKTAAKKTAKKVVKKVIRKPIAKKVALKKKTKKR